MFDSSTLAMKHFNPIPTLCMVCLEAQTSDMDDNAGPNLAVGSGLCFTVYNLFLIHLRPML